MGGLRPRLDVEDIDPLTSPAMYQIVCDQLAGWPER